MFDIYSDFDKEKINEITLKFKVLRTKKEKREECISGPGKEDPFGHKCNICENKNTICLTVSVCIDNTAYSYVTSKFEDIAKALKIICDESILIKE